MIVMVWKYLTESLKRGTVGLVRRSVYPCMMIVMPLLCAFFLLNLMQRGTLYRIPVGVVDQDNSSLSRTLTRNLSALQTVDVQYHYSNYQEAASAVQTGQVLGFFLIPSDFSRKALSGEQPTLSYYINYGYYPPSSMQFKGFKTITVLANGGIVSAAMRTLGVPASSVSATLQPVATHVHQIGNPWTNYSYYLNASFVPCLLQLLIMLVTVFSVGTELKYGTCRQWLRSSGDSMSMAIVGKMLPQAVVWTAVGWAVQWLMYVKFQLPLNGNPWHMILAMPLLVLASQGWGLMALCVVPNFRLASTLCAMFGILSFSFCGFSVPEEALYPWVNAIGHMMPIKYYFLLSIDQALNGIPLYYSRAYYAALIGFAVLPAPLLWRLKRECLNPVYVP